MAALLTSVGDSKDKMAVYLNECRRMGIKVLPPDVGQSIRYFAAVGEDIRFGLGAVRNVGRERRRRHRRVARTRHRFAVFHDFLGKVPVHVANKRTVESLIKAGAFDSLGATRRALMEIHEDATEAAVEAKRKAATGAIGFDFDSLYDEAEEVVPAKVPDRPEWTKKDKLAFEREMLGLYVSDHPLAGLEIPLAKHASTSIHDLLASEDVSDGDQVTVAGLVTSVQHRVAKSSGNPYGMITVEDFDGEVTVMFMGKTYTEFQSMLQGDSILVVRGRVSRAATTGSTCMRSRRSRPISARWRPSGPLVLIDARAARERGRRRRAAADAPAPPGRHRGHDEAARGIDREGVRGAASGAGDRRSLRRTEGTSGAAVPRLISSAPHVPWVVSGRRDAACSAAGRDDRDRRAA